MSARKVIRGAEARPIGATSLAERSLAPDLARGAMLLLIALANVPLYLYGTGHDGYGLWMHGYPLLDQTIVALQTDLVRGRAYPMFALLFGYGVVQLLRRHTSRGVDEADVRTLLRRRGWWMVLIGFLHAVLLAGLLTRAGTGLCCCSQSCGRCRSCCSTSPEVT